MTATNDPSHIDPLSLDPRAAHLAEAFRGALVRMRDGEKLTTGDLDVAADLLQMVQAANGISLAATVMPMFKEVFQDRRDDSIPSEESTVPPSTSPAPSASATPAACNCVRKSPEPRWW
ncbi:hypothetical protein [Streptomyces cyaneus]|uniref:hypothetical protein n=1 Tax=Streptomyces cyaneus TaxID=1904 RepID=UPI000FF8B2C4|nr:hypothetical protein [Streptomyces cyaneus]